VVLETSSGDFPSYEQARKHSVAAFISKPFRLVDVVETCRRILGGARPLMGRDAQDAPPASVQVRDTEERLLAVGTLVDADAGGAQIEIDAALGQGQQVMVTVLGPPDPSATRPRCAGSAPTAAASSTACASGNRRPRASDVHRERRQWGGRGA
jgi:hypothetical protein